MSSKTGVADRRTATVLRCNRVAASQLPDPDEEFTKSELPEPLQNTFHRFADHNIIKPVERDRGCWTWRTSDTAARWVDRYIGDLDTLPCGHTGLQNPRDTDDFTCSNDGCDSTYSRGDVVEHFQDGDER